MGAIKAAPPKGIRALGHALAALALALLPQAGPVHAAQGGRGRAITPDFAFMVGSWTDDGDCTHAARLDPDGRFHTADGAEGLWVVEGGRLILTGRPERVPAATERGEAGRGGHQGDPTHPGRMPTLPSL